MGLLLELPWSYQPGNCIPIFAVETQGVRTLTRLTAGTGPAPIAGSSPPFPIPNGWRPRWVQRGLGLGTKAAEAPLISKQRRPPSQSGGGAGGPKAALGPAPKQMGLGCTKAAEQPPPPLATGPPVVGEGRMPRPQSSSVPCGAKVGEAPAANWPGRRYFESGTGSFPQAMELLVL